MRKIFVTSPTTITLIACLLVVTAFPAFAATVSSITNKGTRQNELGETIAIVNVKCSSSTSEPRVIVSKEGDRSWCSQDIPDACSRDKVTAAIKVCRYGFSSQIEDYKSAGDGLARVEETALPSNDISGGAPVADNQVAVDEINLEKERIRREQQKLEIRRQELELHKRRLESVRQSTTSQ